MHLTLHFLALFPNNLQLELDMEGGNVVRSGSRKSDILTISGSERDEWEKMSMDLLEELELVRCEARHAKGRVLAPGPCEPWQHQCEGCQVDEARLKGEMAAMEAEVRASLEQRDEARVRHLDNEHYRLPLECLRF